MIYPLVRDFTTIRENKGVIENLSSVSNLEIAISENGYPEIGSGIVLKPRQKMPFECEDANVLYARLVTLSPADRNPAANVISSFWTAGGGKGNMNPEGNCDCSELVKAALATMSEVQDRISDAKSAALRCQREAADSAARAGDLLARMEAARAEVEAAGANMTAAAGEAEARITEMVDGAATEAAARQAAIEATAEGAVAAIDGAARGASDELAAARAEIHNQVAASAASASQAEDAAAEVQRALKGLRAAIQEAAEKATEQAVANLTGALYDTLKSAQKAQILAEQAAVDALSAKYGIRDMVEEMIAAAEERDEARHAVLAQNLSRAINNAVIAAGDNVAVAARKYALVYG